MSEQDLPPEDDTPLNQPEQGRDPFGIPAYLQIAVPLVISVACFSLTLFTDRTLLLWFNPVSSGASVAAGNLYWMFACVPVSALGFVTPLIAQLAGRLSEPQPIVQRKIAHLVWQSVWITAAFMPLFALLAMAGPFLFSSFGHAESLAQEEAAYFGILLAAAPASMLEAGLSAYFVGQRTTRPIMQTNFATAGLNVLLDFWLIFGAFGVPALGVQGAALATTLSVWFKAAVYGVLLSRDAHFRRASLAAWRPELARMREILQPGFTLGLQQLTRSFVFSAILLKIGAATVTGLAATSAALSVYQLLAIPLIGLSSAVTVLVGQAAAQNGRSAVKVSLRSGMLLGAGYAATIIAGMLFAPGLLLSLSASGMSPAEAEEVIPLASRLLAFAAVYCLGETIVLLVAAALKGFGKTFIILAATVVASLLGVSLGYAWEPAGFAALFWWWTVMAGWAGTQAVILLLALRRSLSQFQESEQLVIPDRLAA
ncbi:MAG: multi antimicrobial extrusion protein MatE [Planctomyces sp.]|nr:multi antimicrobial extrusion protein MatE [Planctomyces sp.]